MEMKRAVRIAYGAAFIAGALLSLAPLAHAQDDGFAACIQELAERDLAGRTAFQEGVRDLIVAEMPEFQDLADLSMELQIAFAQSRVARIAYLLEADPARIETGSLAKFRNFDWSAADDAAFAAQNSAAGELSARIADLRGRNDGHRDWPKLREFVQAELMPGAGFRALVAVIAENDKAVRKGLKGCRRG